MRKTLMLVLVVFAAGVPLAVTQVATAQESKLSEKQTGQLIKRFPKSAETKTYEADSEITTSGKRGRPLLGVQRWDMFSGKGATQQKELGYLPGKQGFLKDSQWHDRVPFFCRLTKDVDWIEHPANAGPVWFNHPFSQQLLQESMDQELRYAHNAGIDFFVYHGPARKLYANGWELRNNFDCHLSSKIPEAKKVNFTWALYAHRAIRYTRSKVATMMDETIEYITMPNWQTVMDGRPLIVVYHPERFRAALQVAQGKEHMTGAGFVEYIRARVDAAGLKTPYIVGCMEPRDSFMHAETLKEEGYDAFMDYEGAYGGAVAKRDEAPTYASATEEILKTCEQEYLNRGLPFLPPCPSMHYRWPHAFDRKGQAIEKLHHFQWPKEGDLEARVEAVLDFVATHPEDCEAQTVIMYSWNEHSGGGGICPTMGKSPEYEPETQWLDEVAEALATWKYPPKDNPKDDDKKDDDKELSSYEKMKEPPPPADADKVHGKDLPAPTHAVGANTSAQKRPNIIFILSDDVSPRDYALYGGKTVSPVLEKLGAEGLYFKTAWATPRCVPTRAMLLSGKYPFRTGVYENQINPRGEDNRIKPVGERFPNTLGSLMTANGYRTAMVGKLQTGDVRSYGFQRWCTVNHGRIFDMKHSDNDEDGKQVVQPNVHSTDSLFDYLHRFTAEKAEDPWFVYMPLNLPHSVRNPDNPDKWGPPVVPELDENWQKTGRMVQNDFEASLRYLDYKIGGFVAHLKATGQLENTIIMYAGDNGTHRYGKSNPDSEKGPRVPFVVYAPGILEPMGACDELVDFTDVIPTCVELAGGALPEGDVFDGRSFAPLIRGESFEGREWIFSQWFGLRFLRTRHHLIDGRGRFYHTGDNRNEWVEGAYRDITESHDERVIAMRKRLERILEKMPAPDYGDPELAGQWKKHWIDTRKFVEPYRPPYLK